MHRFGSLALSLLVVLHPGGASADGGGVPGGAGGGDGSGSAGEGTGVHPSSSPAAVASLSSPDRPSGPPAGSLSVPAAGGVSAPPPGDRSRPRSVILPGRVPADTTRALPLDSLFPAHSYALSERDGRLAGPGRDLLLEAARGTRFFIIGESHFRAEIPRITAMLFAALHEREGYEYLAVENGPWIMRRLSDPSVRGDTAASFALAARYPSGLQFPSDEEVEMLARVGAISTAPDDPLWGLDRPFGATHVLDGWRTPRPTPTPGGGSRRSSPRPAATSGAARRTGRRAGGSSRSPTGSSSPASGRRSSPLPGARRTPCSGPWSCRTAPTGTSSGTPRATPRTGSARRS